jgi:hypothetical protein
MLTMCKYVLAVEDTCTCKLTIHTFVSRATLLFSRSSREGSKVRTIRVHRKMLEGQDATIRATVVIRPTATACLMSHVHVDASACATTMPLQCSERITRVAKTSYCNQTKHHRQYPAPLSLANHPTSLANTSANS